MLLRVLLWYCVAWHTYARPLDDQQRSQTEIRSSNSTDLDAKRQTIQQGGVSLPFPLTIPGNEAGQGGAVPILLPNTVPGTVQNGVSGISGIQQLDSNQVAPNVLQNPGQANTIGAASAPAANSPLVFQLPNQQAGAAGQLQLQNPLQAQSQVIGTTLSSPSSPCGAAPPGQPQPLVLNPQPVGLPCNAPVPEQAPCGTPCNIVCNLPAPPPPPQPCNQEYQDHDDVHHHEYECLHKHHHYYHHHHVDDDDDDDRCHDHHNCNNNRNNYNNNNNYNSYNDNGGGYDNEYAGLNHHDNQHYEHNHYHDHSYHPCEHSYTPEHYDDGFRESHFHEYGSQPSNCHKKSTFPKKHKHSHHH